MKTDGRALDESKIAWLIPCYNEELTVGRVVDDIKKHCPRSAIYVYDNNSKDKTVDVARAHGAEVRFEHQQGKGHVVRRMFNEIDADYYIMIDGDSTYDVASWRKVLEPILNLQSDMVVASRLEDHSQASFRPLHVFGNIFLCSVVRTLFRTKIKDMLSGYRAFNRKLVKGIPLNAKGFEIETELTIQSLENDFRIVEVPVPYRERPEGSFSKLNTFQDGFIILFFILRLLKDYKPLTFFGSVSIVFFLAAFCSWKAFGVHYGFMFGICGLLSLCTGVILNAISQGVREIAQIIRKN